MLKINAFEKIHSIKKSADELYKAIDASKGEEKMIEIAKKNLEIAVMWAVDAIKL